MKRCWLTLALAPPAVAEWAKSHIAAGRRFSLFSDSANQTVVGSGTNQYGQLSGEEDQSSNVKIFGDQEEMVQVAAGAFHSLAVTSSGKVYAVGRNNFGQLGDGTSEDRREPVLVAEGVSRVAAGYGHSVFMMSDGTVQVAGYNSAGQLGLGDGAGRKVLVKTNVALPAGEQVEDVAAGYDFTYVRTSSKKAYATGQNLAGQLGIGGPNRPTNILTEVDVAGVIDMAAGDSHGLFLDESMKVHGYGADYDGQAAGANSAEGVTGVFAGGDVSVFTTGDGTFGFGGSRSCQLGLKGVFDFPEKVSDMEFETVAIGDSHALYLNDEDRKVYGAGSNFYFEVTTPASEMVCDLTLLSSAPTTAPPETMTSSAASTTTRLVGGDDDDDDDGGDGGDGGVDATATTTQGGDGAGPAVLGPPESGPALILILVAGFCCSCLVLNGLCGGNAVSGIQEDEMVNSNEQEYAAQMEAEEKAQAEALENSVQSAGP